MKRINYEVELRPLSQFRAHAAGLLAKVRHTKRAIVLTQRAHTVAVVLDASEYQRLVDEVELLRDLHAALGQLERAEGVQHRSAQARALAKLEE